MNTISPQLSLVVNQFPEAVRQPIAELLASVKKIFEVSELTPGSFAQAESELVATIVKLGCELNVSLTAQFAAQSEVISMTSKEGESRHYRRIEPTTLKVVTPFGRGTIERALYREAGVHNGATIDPVALRCGLLHGATPRAVQLIGAFTAAVPSREAEVLVQQLGIETLSRSTIERIAHHFGEHLEEHRDELDGALLQEFEIPEEAVSLSVSVDRVSVPIEKSKPRPSGRPRKGAPRRPIEVVYQMAFVLCWTLYNKEGLPLYTARGGRMPYDGASHEVEERLRWDVQQLLEKRPDLKVASLSDGALEMIQLLQRATADIDVVVQLVDIWHALEYLAAASHAVSRNTKKELKKAKKELVEQEDGALRVLTRMQRWRTKVRKAKKKVPKALNDAIRYFENKIEAGLMEYAKAYANGLPIGSGTIEATAKTLVSIRMKRSGSRWKHQSGQHVLTLRSHLLSERWGDVMSWHVAQNDDQIPDIRDVA